ncbi:MAG: hypothetical protein WDO24_06775 [Pseudomonadota bacterium]
MIGGAGSTVLLKPDGSGDGTLVNTVATQLVGTTIGGNLDVRRAP